MQTMLCILHSLIQSLYSFKTHNIIISSSFLQKQQRKLEKFSTFLHPSVLFREKCNISALPVAMLYTRQIPSLPFYGHYTVVEDLVGYKISEATKNPIALELRTSIFTIILTIFQWITTGHIDKWEMLVPLPIPNYLHIS